MEQEATSELEDFHYKFKISIVGDTGVGKSSFLEGKFVNVSDLSKLGQSG